MDCRFKRDIDHTVRKSGSNITNLKKRIIATSMVIERPYNLKSLGKGQGVSVTFQIPIEVPVICPGTHHGRVQSEI